MMIIALLASQAVLGRTADDGLTDQQQAAIKAWLTIDADARPDIETLGLPDQLTRKDVHQLAATLWEIYAELASQNEGAAELGELPPALTELRAAADGGRPMIEARKMTLGELV